MNLFIFHISTVQTKKVQGTDHLACHRADDRQLQFRRQRKSNFFCLQNKKKKKPKHFFFYLFFLFFLVAGLFFFFFSFSFHNCSAVGKAYFCVSLSQYSTICMRVRGEKEKRNTETASDISSDLLY